MMGCRNLFCFLIVIHVVWSISCLKENWMEGGRKRPLTNAVQKPTGETACCIKMNYLLKDRKLVTIELGPKVDQMLGKNLANKPYCLVGRSDMRCCCYADRCNSITNIQTFIDMETREPFGEVLKEEGHSMYLPKDEKIRVGIMRRVQSMVKSAMNHTIANANESKTLPCGKGHMITEQVIETKRDITNSSALEGEICAFDISIGPSCSIEDGEMDIAPEVKDIEANMTSFCFVGVFHISCRCRTPYCNMRVVNLIKQLEIEYDNGVGSPDFLDEEESDRYLNPVTEKLRWRYMIECVREQLFNIKVPPKVNQSLLQELPKAKFTHLNYHNQSHEYWKGMSPDGSGEGEEEEDEEEDDDDSHPSLHYNIFLYLLSTLLFILF